MAMSTEKKVGFFFLIALIALGGIIELVEDWRPFEKQHHYQAYFDSAVGIKAGDPVRMAGVEVGKISTIGIENQKVRVDFYVADGTVIREDSLAEVRQTNLLGGQFLGLGFGSPDSRELAPGAMVTTREGANIDQLITHFDQNQEKVFGQLGALIAEMRGPLADAAHKIDSIAGKIDRGEGMLGRMVNDPALYDDLGTAVADLNRLLRSLDEGEGTLGRLMTDASLYDDAAETVANLRIITAGVKAGKGTIGKLMVEEQAYDDAADALANIRRLTGKIDSGEGTLGQLVNDEALYNEFHGTMVRVNSIVTKVDEGQGTLGRLVNEDDIYREAKTTLHKVEKTVDGLSDTGPLSALGVVLGTLF